MEAGSGRRAERRRRPLRRRPRHRGRMGGKESRSKRLRKESRYLQDLRSGVGSATGRARDPVIPKGLQEGTKNPVTVEEVDEEGNVVEKAQHDEL